MDVRHKVLQVLDLLLQLDHKRGMFGKQPMDWLDAWRAEPDGSFLSMVSQLVDAKRALEEHGVFKFDQAFGILSDISLESSAAGADAVGVGVLARGPTAVCSLAMVDKLDHAAAAIGGRHCRVLRCHA